MSSPVSWLLTSSTQDCTSCPRLTRNKTTPNITPGLPGHWPPDRAHSVCIRHGQTSSHNCAQREFKPSAHLLHGRARQKDKQNPCWHRNTSCYEAIHTQQLQSAEKITLSRLHHLRPDILGGNFNFSTACSAKLVALNELACCGVQFCLHPSLLVPFSTIRCSHVLRDSQTVCDRRSQSTWFSGRSVPASTEAVFSSTNIIGIGGHD